MKKSYLIILTLFSFPFLHVSGQVLNDTTVTAPSTFTRTVPATLTMEITVRAFGGGGGGGTTASDPAAAGGGGGGAYAESNLTLPAGDYVITIGAGGAAGATGTPTVFEESGGSILVRAAAGEGSSEQSGGLGGSATNSIGSTTNAGGDGGNAGNCAGANTGGGGGGAASDQLAVGGVGGTGACGPPAGGTGGTGGTGTNTVNGGSGGMGGEAGGGGGGNFASAPGGGGGGKAEEVGAASASGASGRIEIVVNAVLPIELVSFEGTALKNTVELNWTTASEVNNDFVAIERSEDAVNFIEIGRIPGQGDTEEERSYAFVDKAPMPGLNYYRLRQVDFNGDENRHAIIVVDVEIEQVPSTMNIYPNPAQDMLQVAWELPLRRSASLELYDMTGKLLKREKVSPLSASHQLSTENLPTGLYLLHFTSGDQVEVKRFEKE